MTPEAKRDLEAKAASAKAIGGSVLMSGDTLSDLLAENARLRAAIEPMALLAPEESGVSGVLMSDPLSRWFTIAQIVEARAALNEQERGS